MAYSEGQGISINLQQGVATAVEQKQDLRVLLSQRFEFEAFPRVRLDRHPDLGSRGEIYNTYARAAEVLGWVSFQLSQPEIFKESSGMYLSHNLLPAVHLMESLSMLSVVANLDESTPESFQSLLALLQPYLERNALALMHFDEIEVYTRDDINRYLNGKGSEDGIPATLPPSSGEVHHDFAKAMYELSQQIDHFDQLNHKQKHQFLINVQHCARMLTESRMKAMKEYYKELDELPWTWEQFQKKLRAKKSITTNFAEDSSGMQALISHTEKISHDYRTPITTQIMQRQLIARKQARGEAIEKDILDAAEQKVFSAWGELYRVTRARAQDMETARLSEKMVIDNEINGEKAIRQYFVKELQEAQASRPFPNQTPIYVDFVGAIPDELKGKSVWYSQGQLESLAKGIMSNAGKVLATKTTDHGQLYVSVAVVDENGNDWNANASGKMHMSLRIDDNLGGFPPELGIAMNVIDPSTGQLGRGFEGQHGYDKPLDADEELTSSGIGMANLRRSAKMAYSGELATYNISENKFVRNRDGSLMTDASGNPLQQIVTGARYEVRIPLSR